MNGSLDCEASFVHKVKTHLNQSHNAFPDFDGFLREIFLVAAERGLNDDEFAIILNLITTKGSLGITNKKKLFPNLIPCVKAPSEAMMGFMSWFISNYRTMNKKFVSCILQWIFGLVYNDLVDTNVIDGFYFDFYQMLDYCDLFKYACALLCKFTKPRDVTGSAVRKVRSKMLGDGNDKFFIAVLSLFKGYKPHLVPDDLKRVDINTFLKQIPQITPLFELRVRKLSMVHTKPGVISIPQITTHHVQRECTPKLSSLIPFPIYSAEELDQFGTCYPRSVQEALRNFKSVPIPQNILSLLRDEVGFFIITHLGVDLQVKLSRILLCTLQDVLINQVLEASEDDKMFLLSQTYKLQIAMQQGIPCVSTFLAGFLLNWDGLGYRTLILDLLEWATFDSFTDLSANILRPVYMLFCTNNVAMRQQILQAVSSLIKNMMLADIYRVNRGLLYPFLGRAPKWTQEPQLMMAPLIQWVEQLIKVGMCLAPDNSNFLLQAIQFYELMNMLEEDSPIPMWTVLPRGVVYHCVLNLRPIELNRICRLLLRYHREFLPKLRKNHPQFYNDCGNKINLTSKYVQELMNLLWIGQAMTRKEDGVFFKNIPETDLEAVNSQVINLDNTFDLAHNINFLPYILKERQKNGREFCQKMEDFLALVDYYLEDIGEFIKYFSPSNPNPNNAVL